MITAYYIAKWHSYDFLFQEIEEMDDGTDSGIKEFKDYIEKDGTGAGSGDGNATTNQQLTYRVTFQNHG